MFPVPSAGMTRIRFYGLAAVTGLSVLTDTPGNFSNEEIDRTASPRNRRT